MPRSDTRIFQQLARAWTLRRRPVSRRSCATTATCDRARRCICRRSRSSSTTTTCRVASASTRRATPAKRSSSSIIGTAARAERRRCLERPKHRPHPLLRRLPPLLLHRRRLLLQCRYRCRYRCRRRRWRPHPSLPRRSSSRRRPPSTNRRRANSPAPNHNRILPKVLPSFVFLRFQSLVRDASRFLSSPTFFSPFNVFVLLRDGKRVHDYCFGLHFTIMS